MKTFRDAGHYRNQNMKHLAEGLIAALNHERACVPPVEVPYDLDTAAMLCCMSRKQLQAYLRDRSDQYKYKMNRLTMQRFLIGDDIKRIREDVIREQDTGYTERAKKLPCVQKHLAKIGLAESGSE